MKVRPSVVGLAAVAAAGVAIGAPAAHHAAPAASHPAAGHPAAPAGRQAVTGPVAVYWMSASTQSGMGGMGMGGAGGGRRPSMAAMMMGGGRPDPNAFTHSLILQLGSARRAPGAPQAEHDPPQGLGAGPVLPLLTPEQAQHVEAEPGPPPQYQQPHGRMLIFWGCGEHAPPGQPYVIDFARLGQGAGAQQFAALTRGLGIAGMQPPSPTRNTTYGEWPNRDTRTEVPAEGSLQGAHTIRGNYTPDINFSLEANQDFLPPFRLTTNEKNPSGSASLGWRPVDGSQGYFATMIGGSGQDQVVMWTSSANQASAFGIPEYLSDGEIARLVANHTLMPSSQTACTIPVEAVQAAGQGGFFNLVAYGGETNLSYPPRPPAPQPWNIAWQVKIRYRSAISGLVGMDMARMMGGGDDGEGRPSRQQQQQQQQQHRRSNPFGGLGGLGGVLP
ncbi:MAG TPA: hypothetical protein VG939_20805 [Caulobacteraceae bacterium]|nr:hypothetical protein [Caulobacteraceae bacterium]